jgi:hypothetical protein
MKLFNKFKRAVGIKNKYTVREIKEGGKLKADRLERFRKWRKEQG